VQIESISNVKINFSLKKHSLDNFRHLCLQFFSISQTSLSLNLQKKSIKNTIKTRSKKEPIKIEENREAYFEITNVTNFQITFLQLRT